MLLVVVVRLMIFIGCFDVGSVVVMMRKRRVRFFIVGDLYDMV